MINPSVRKQKGKLGRRLHVEKEQLDQSGLSVDARRKGNSRGFGLPCAGDHLNIQTSSAVQGMVHRLAQMHQ